MSTRSMREQPPLSRHTAAIPGQRSIGADHAMARNDDRNRIRAVGRADGPTGPGPAYCRCDFSIAFRLAGRDLSQRAPNCALERRAASRRPHFVERGKVAVKIVVE